MLLLVRNVDHNHPKSLLGPLRRIIVLDKPHIYGVPYSASYDFMES